MAIQTQVNYDPGSANNIGFTVIGGGSEFPLSNNGGFDQSFINLQSQKNMNLLPLFNHQQNQSRRFLAAHIEQQKHDIDQLIRLQNDSLRYVLQEQRKQQMGLLLRKMEAKASVLISQKDEEIARVSNTKMELEALLSKLEVENQTWQRVARENEAMVTSLNNTLEQVRERACIPASPSVEDEGSCCGGGVDLLAAAAEEVRGCLAGGKIGRCRNCGYGETRVLFLPCRHLCCCTNCEASLVLCPVCNTPKKASIEALIF